MWICFQIIFHLVKGDGDLPKQPFSILIWRKMWATSCNYQRYAYSNNFLWLSLCCHPKELFYTHYYAVEKACAQLASLRWAVLPFSNLFEGQCAFHPTEGQQLLKRLQMGNKAEAADSRPPQNLNYTGKNDILSCLVCEKGQSEFFFLPDVIS